MRLAYFDPIGGASGDMIVSSLIDAGVDFEALGQALDALGLNGEYSLEAKRVVSHQIAATNFRVETPRHHHHDHDHGSHGRRLSDIEAILANMPDPARSNAIAVFRKLGEAETKVHGKQVDDIHFHEVGAVDSIVDIAAACIALDMLQVERLFVGPLPLSRGTVNCAHGQWPVPGPATTELLAGFRWRNTDIEGELVTPTAAAIFATLGQDSQSLPPFSSEATGYGAGSNDYGIPNVLRVCVGQQTKISEGGHEHQTVVIECCIDDSTPEILGYTMEQLMAAGALDVWFTAVQMKKNRPGVMLSALAWPENSRELADIILRETSTLGVRLIPSTRICLPREIVTVTTQWGDVRIKVGVGPGGVRKGSPEYEDVRALASEHHVPAQQVYQEATLLFSASAEPCEDDTNEA